MPVPARKSLRTSVEVSSVGGCLVWASRSWTAALRSPLLALAAMTAGPARAGCPGPRRPPPALPAEPAAP
eukprot:954957-Alexandrium_andersonii.AAC.1